MSGVAGVAVVALMFVALQFPDPLAACKAVVQEAYELWLQYEVRTDDITMICLFIEPDMSEITPKTRTKSKRMSVTSQQFLQRAQEHARPVRRSMSKAKRRAVGGFVAVAVVCCSACTDLLCADGYRSNKRP